MPYIIAAAIVRRSGHLLLVDQQSRYEPEGAWVLPGGRVEPGEDVHTALERELREETGLVLRGQPTLIFGIHDVRGDRDYIALSFACQVDGTIDPNDPDGLVRGAEWVPEAEAIKHLTQLDWYDEKPLLKWLESPKIAVPFYVYAGELASPALAASGTEVASSGG